jgi:hypothetical protein
LIYNLGLALLELSMIRLLSTSLAILLLCNAACFAAFDFSVQSVAYDAFSGATLRVSVTNTGGASVSPSKIDAPLQFTMSGGMTSAQLTSVTSVSGAFGMFASQNDLPLSLPATLSNNQIVDFSGIYAPGLSIAPGATIALWDVSLGFSGMGGLMVSLSEMGQFGANDLGLDSTGNGDFVPAFVDGSVIGATGSTATFVSAVPEPSSFLLLGLVGAAVGGSRWYKKRRNGDVAGEEVASEEAAA